MPLSSDPLLQEEVHRLEDQLKSVREKQWMKEKEWLKANKELQEDNYRLQAHLQKVNQSEVFHMVKGNLTSLQDEIDKLKEDKNQSAILSTSTSSGMPSFSTSKLSPGDDVGLNALRYVGESVEDRYTRLATVPSPAEDSSTHTFRGLNPQSKGVLPQSGSPNNAAAAATALSSDVLKNYQKAMDDNVKLRVELEQSKQKVRKIESLMEGKTVECRELEVKVATLQKKVLEGGDRPYLLDQANPGGRSSSSSSNQQSPYTSTDTAALQEEVKQLRSALARTQSASLDFQRRCEDLSCHNRALQNEVEHLKSQLEGIQGTEKLHVTKERQQRRNKNKELAWEEDEEEEEYTSDEEGSTYRSGAGPLPSHLLQLSRDRRDCLDELVRQLEQQWALEDPFNSHTFLSSPSSRQWSRYPGPSTLPPSTALALDAPQRTSARSPTRERRKAQKERESSHTPPVKPSDDRKQKRKASKNKEIRGTQSLDKETEKRQRSDSKRDHSQKDKDKKTKEELYAVLSPSLASNSYHSSHVHSKSPSAVLTRAEKEERLQLLNQRHLSAKSSLSGEESEELLHEASEGAHLSVTILRVEQLNRHCQKFIQDDGEVFIKLKSLKEKYKTTLRPFATPAINFGEIFQFHLAQPHQDVISLHVYFKSHSVPSREYHIGDCCFSLATLFKGIPRERQAPIVENAATPLAKTAGMITVRLQTDDFGILRIPTAEEINNERLRFAKRVNLYTKYAPEKLHTVDVFMATEPVVNALI